MMKIRPALFAALLLVAMPLAGLGGAALGDEADEAIKEYRLLLDLRGEFIATRDDPDASADMRDGAKTNLDRIDRVQIPYMEEQLRKLGVKIVRAKPGETVLVKDPPIAAEAERKAGSPCDRYDDYVRPAVSVNRLPPLDRQNGAQRALARELLALEDELVRVSTWCEDEWDAQKAADWAALRETLARKFVALEGEYAMTFNTQYTDEENKIIAKAYENRPEYRLLEQEEPAQYREYMRRKAEWDKLVKRYGGLKPATPQARLQMQQIEAAYLAARTIWRKNSSRMNEILRVELESLREVRAQRAMRGIRNMKELHPGTEFEVHRPSDFWRMESPVLNKLLGPDGMDILKKEGGRRFTARNRN
jgi:hypothetical protein